MKLTVSPVATPLLNSLSLSAIVTLAHLRWWPHRPAPL